MQISPEDLSANFTIYRTYCHNNTYCIVELLIPSANNKMLFHWKYINTFFSYRKACQFISNSNKIIGKRTGYLDRFKYILTKKRINNNV